MIPTLKEQEEMARWAGFEKPPCDRVGGCLKRLCIDYSCKCDRWEANLPDFTDPTTLFKLVVPKVYEKGFWIQLSCDTRGTSVSILKGPAQRNWSMVITDAVDESSGLALFWACYKLLKEEK